MGKRISFNNDELWLLNRLVAEVARDGGDYVNSGKYGKRILKQLEAKLKFTDLQPSDSTPPQGDSKASPTT